LLFAWCVANNSIQHAAVQYILSTVVEELQKNPARKFMYVEQAFFQRWYERQTQATQNIVKKLVAAGQLEFINGGQNRGETNCLFPKCVTLSCAHSLLSACCLLPRMVHAR